MNIVDSSCWLEFFAGTEAGDEFASIIEDTSNMLVPSIVLYEVFKKLLSEVGEDKAIMAIAHMKLGRVIDLDGDLAIYSAKVGKEHGLAMADSVIYATALRNGATLFTQDRHFEKLRLVKYFKKIAN